MPAGARPLPARWTGREAVTTGGSLPTDIGNAALDRLDERGLMPLDEARAWLAGRDAYVKGDFVPTTASFSVTEADRTWAALLSLADGAEFLAQTRRLTWIFGAVRGMENTAALERYGDAVLEWVADNVDDEGDLTNRPWCLLPCLLACTSPAAFDVAAPINTVNGHEVRTNVVTQWILRNPDPGYRVLLDRLDAGVGDAVVALDELVGLDPRGTIMSLAALIGQPAVDDLLDRHEIEVEPLPDAVRTGLDAAPVLDLGPPSRPVSIGAMDEEFTSAQAPIFDNLNYFCASAGRSSRSTSWAGVRKVWSQQARSAVIASIAVSVRPSSSEPNSVCGTTLTVATPLGSRHSGVRSPSSLSTRSRVWSMSRELSKPYTAKFSRTAPSPRPVQSTWNTRPSAQPGTTNPVRRIAAQK